MKCMAIVGIFRNKRKSIGKKETTKKTKRKEKGFAFRAKAGAACSPHKLYLLR